MRSPAHRIAPPESGRRLLFHYSSRAAKVLPKLRRREFLARKTRALWRRGRNAFAVIVDRHPFDKLAAVDRFVANSPSNLALPALPRFDHPEASIVIPVYNHLKDTLICLESIKASSPSAAYEVIVVDDGSSHRTMRSLSRIEGLTYVRNAQNQGFIGSCNRGASAARGEYLVFLNNDTVVCEGWLDALLATFRDIPEAGLAGAKLIYPDGRLQEAGGVIWRDASGWNYGRGDDPDHPRYNFVREVDYCSGACIMVPRALFERLGGFDRRYSPAYYEDTDLAFKIHEAGHKVIYQPMARIIHHEGLTSGTSLESGVKAYQLANQPKFQERWADRLASHPDRPDQQLGFVQAHRRRSGSAGQVLVIDHRLPYPDRDGGSFRMMEILRCIRRRNHHVTFYPDNLEVASPYLENLLNIGVEVIHLPYYRSLAECLEEKGRKFKLAILSRCHVASRHMTMVKKLAPRAKVVFDTVDLHYKREERQAELFGDESLSSAAAALKQQELRLALRADLTLVVSPVEKAVLEAENPDFQVEVLSNIHPMDNVEPPPFDERRDILFIGGFEHPPNVDAVLFFAREILPRVQERIPEAVFDVIGPVPPPAIRDLAGPGIRVHGHVPDVRPFFDRARVAVAPMRFRRRHQDQGEPKHGDSAFPRLSLRLPPRVCTWSTKKMP